MSSLLSKFRGSVVGGVVGDCLGAYYEGDTPISLKKLTDFFCQLEASADGGSKSVYTDDTAMARSVASSLIDNKGLDVKDMAQRFVIEYMESPFRGYGASVGDVFVKLKNQKCSDPFGPASQQFGGSGSYGNGGAMRISPAAVFAYNSTPNDLNKIVRDITRITHSNEDAINGAILQAYAVHLALHDTSESLDTYSFLQNLLAHIRPLEEKSSSSKTQDGSPEAKRMTRGDVEKEHNTYCAKLERIKDYLQREYVTVAEIENHLGTDVSAKGSVPAAVYSFLRASQPIRDLQIENPFERTILYAISLGGDTDTIASMAGAIAGAYYGIEAIPVKWQKMCEGVDDAIKFADDLYKIRDTSGGVQNCEPTSSNSADHQASCDENKDDSTRDNSDPN